MIHKYCLPSLSFRYFFNPLSQPTFKRQKLLAIDLEWVNKCACEVTCVLCFPENSVLIEVFMEHLLRTSMNTPTTRPFSSVRNTVVSMHSLSLRMWIGKSWFIHVQNSLFFYLTFLKMQGRCKCKISSPNHLRLLVSNTTFLKFQYTKIAETYFQSFFLKSTVWVFVICCYLFPVCLLLPWYTT